MAARLVHSDHDLLDLNVREGHATLRTLHTTSNHPFWDDTLHAWVAAGRLVPGHSLITADNRHVVVADVVARPGAAEMYNLTVTELHTYYVLAGGTPVLVHNDDKNLCRVLGISQVTLNQIVGDAYRDHIADSMRQRGLSVVTEAEKPHLLTLPTPYGKRRYDIGTLDSNGDVSWYIETKSGGVGKDPLQEKKDAWLKQNLGIKIQYVFDE
ncbi:polymorphic toxin-type HINT domain-containing protein [Streptomyces sp. NPDC058678]|uniref:polymorphic toxin-type HINT domain-containing protein n=1 Tax=Streptomyces sp. NPDC058678 TaxID=3346595 RepID=UPI00366A4BA5